jgi:hypothetical protein
LNPLLKNAYDLHVHSAPDVMPRKMDDIEMAQRIIAAGMKGYAIKSHYFCTAERATLIRKMYPGCNTIGTISLNNAVGGINPTAVEMAGRAGVKLVWFPTVDSQNEQNLLGTIPPEKRGYWAKIQDQMRAEGVTSTPIYMLENGKLKKEVFGVIDAIARYNMILATGHITKEETFALVKAAKERKVKRILITHVTFPSTIYSIEEQKELLKFANFVEHCYTSLSTGKIPWNTVYEQIRAIGPERVVLTTDLGQPTALYPDEGVADFAKRLLENGFSEADFRTMFVKNPASLVE